MKWKCPRCNEICVKYKMEVNILEQELEVLCTKCGLHWYPENIPTKSVEHSCSKSCPNCHGNNTKLSRKKTNDHSTTECVCLICGFLWDPDEFEFDETKEPSEMTGAEYEKQVAENLKIEGYTDVIVTKASGDHGADILAITPNGLTAVIQCKFYKSTVGQEAVQQAVSAREYYHRSQAIVITNSTFTPAAEDFARHTNTILIEGYTT